MCDAASNGAQPLHAGQTLVSALIRLVMAGMHHIPHHQRPVGQLVAPVIHQTR